MITIYLFHYIDTDPKQRHITEHILGRQLLSFGLNELYGLQILDGQLNGLLEKGPHGKPMLSSRSDIHFNICHCQTLVACAFSDTEIGIDAENIRPFRDKIFRKVLTSSEQMLMNASTLTQADREELFFRFWTLKESRIKQSGTGMAVSLTDFSFEPDMNTIFSRPKSSLSELSFWQWKLDSGHILSVCTSSREDTPVIKSLQSDTFSW